MAFAYTNRKGRTYYLHRTLTKKGKARYYFAKTVGDSAVDEVPADREAGESINGVVFVRKKRPRVITREEEQAVLFSLRRLGLGDYRVDVKCDSIVVYEPSTRVGELEGVLAELGMSPRSGDLRRIVEPGMCYLEIMKFTMCEEDPRTFEVYRMTYRGAGGWSYPLHHGDLADLADEFLPHLGRESFFDLC